MIMAEAEVQFLTPRETYHLVLYRAGKMALRNSTESHKNRGIAVEYGAKALANRLESQRSSIEMEWNWKGSAYDRRSLGHFG